MEERLRAVRKRTITSVSNEQWDRLLWNAYLAVAPPSPYTSLASSIPFSVTAFSSHRLSVRDDTLVTIKRANLSNVTTFARHFAARRGQLQSDAATLYLQLASRPCIAEYLEWQMIYARFNNARFWRLLFYYQSLVTQATCASRNFRLIPQYLRHPKIRSSVDSSVARALRNTRSNRMSSTNAEFIVGSLRDS